MSSFSKKCPACKKDFTSLSEYMQHIKSEHKDIPPEEFIKMDQENKWKLRDDF